MSITFKVVNVTEFKSQKSEFIKSATIVIGVPIQWVLNNRS